MFCSTFLRPLLETNLIQFELRSTDLPSWSWQFHCQLRSLPSKCAPFPTSWAPTLSKHLHNHALRGSMTVTPPTCLALMSNLKPPIFSRLHTRLVYIHLMGWQWLCPVESHWISSNRIHSSIFYPWSHEKFRKNPSHVIESYSMSLSSTPMKIPLETSRKNDAFKCGGISSKPAKSCKIPLFSTKAQERSPGLRPHHSWPQQQAMAQCGSKRHNNKKNNW